MSHVPNIIQLLQTGDPKVDRRMRVPTYPPLNPIGGYPLKLQSAEPDLPQGLSKNLRLSDSDGGFKVSPSLKEFGDEIDCAEGKQEVEVSEEVEKRPEDVDSEQVFGSRQTEEEEGVPSIKMAELMPYDAEDFIVVELDKQPSSDEYCPMARTWP